MVAHWKFGHDFAIRYGGRGKIAWLSNGDLSTVANALRVTHPARLVLQSVDTIAAVATWWEARKQTAMLSAMFEERRLLWCSDLLESLVSDILVQDSLALDTVRMLECEFLRTMAVFHNDRRLESPYSFLLQCDRVARGLTSLNWLMHSELRRAAASGNDIVVPDYVPHGQLRTLPSQNAKPGVLDKLLSALPIFRSKDDPLRKSMRSTEKDSQLVYMENLVYELRSAEQLLEALQSVPETEREVGPDEEVAPLDSLPRLEAMLGVRLLSEGGSGDGQPPA